MSTHPNHDSWDACPPGELTRMVRRIDIRRRREALKRMGGVAAAVVVVGLGGYAATEWLGGPREYHYGGIACSEVMRRMPDYMASRLPADLMRRIGVHLEKCPNCGPRYRQMLKMQQASDSPLRDGSGSRTPA